MTEISKKFASYKEIRFIVLPIILSLLAQNVVNITDTAFLGHVGEIELGAAAIGGVYYTILYMIGFGFSTGVQVIIARRYGERDYKNIGQVFQNAIYTLLFMALVIIFFSDHLTPWVLKLMLTSDNIYDSCDRFLDIRVIGVLFSYVNVASRAFFIGIGKTKSILAAAIVMTVVNVVLDYGLIFGELGMPKMGIEGAAIASVIAEATSALFFIFLISRKKLKEKFDMLRMTVPNFDEIKIIFNVSAYSMLQYVLSLSTYLVFFVLIEATGERNLAICNIGRSIYMITFIPVWAFGAAVSSLVSRTIGAGSNDIFPVIKRTAIFCFGVSLFLAIIIGIMPRTVVSMYTSTDGLIDATVLSVYVVLAVSLISSVASIYFNAINGTGKTNVAMRIELITIALYVVAAFILVRMFPHEVAYAWISEFVYHIPIGLMAFAYLNSGKWKSFKI